MIHYAIQHYGSEHDHLLWLVERLHGHCHGIEVALDADATQVEALRAALAPRAVDVVPSAPVTWGGPSLVTQMRDAMLRALARPGWEWFVNLSGACVPIVEPARTVERLQLAIALTGATSFCYGFLVRRSPLWLPFQGPGSGDTHRIARVPARFDAALEALRARGAFDPVRMIEQRRGVFCSEAMIDGGKGLQLRGLLPAEIRDRERFWQNRPWRLGRQWVVLHRTLVEWLCEAPEVSELATWLSQTIIPDETFFQSCLALAPASLQRTIHVRSNLRFTNGGPMLLDRQRLQQARDEGALFARKLGNNAAGLRDYITGTLWQSALPEKPVLGPPRPAAGPRAAAKTRASAPAR